MNDLLDKRDHLESKLVQFVDADISRDSGFYEIKIGGVVALSNDVFEKEINVSDIHEKQIDRFNYIKQNGYICIRI